MDYGDWLFLLNCRNQAITLTTCSRWNRLGLVSFHLGQTARKLGLDLFGATLILGSIVVDFGELELHAADHAVPTIGESSAGRDLPDTRTALKVGPDTPSYDKTARMYPAK